MSDLTQPLLPHTLVHTHNHGSELSLESRNEDGPLLSNPTRANMSVKATGSVVTGEGETVEAKMSRLLGEKVKIMAAIVDKPGPLTFLDLPLDILALIVKEITHTNDLTALAMCHSALHNLAIPHIYSRFDIVWPDNTTDVSPRSGVDALTYGLATLVMGEDVFGEALFQQHNPVSRVDSSATCTHCSHTSVLPLDQTSVSLPVTSLQSQPRAKRKRRGNYYASFTRKFSLGNGPADWVQEYMVTKEGGKMLGTLVALALARMRNLETFIWDMPTGILRDVWIALSSLGDRENGDYSRLEKVWVRWHDNARVDGNCDPPKSPHHQPNTFPQPFSSALGTLTIDQTALRSTSINKVERPTFSILPALKSLNVLDLDELAYLDEMSILIGRSKHCLRELRVGIAKQSSGCDWTGAWEGGGLQQLPPKEANSLLGTSHLEKRLGGILGVLVGHIYDIRHSGQDSGAQIQPPTTAEAADSSQSQLATTSSSIVDNTSAATEVAHVVPISQGGNTTLQNGFKSGNDGSKWGVPRFVEDVPPPDSISAVTSRTNTSSLEKGWTKIDLAQQRQPAHYNWDELRNDGQFLSLQVLELERVPLSITVLCGAFDWTKLRELTILDCPNHEQLWKALRRRFSPRSSPSVGTEVGTSSSPSKSTKSSVLDPTDYVLNLRKIHTNTVTASLITFLKETLAPNTLETLFLQQSVHYTSKVGMDAIFRGPIRHHRASLKHLLADSRTPRREDDHQMTGSRKWAFDREVLNFITSGKMPKLRELAISIDSKDWHFLLQRLPSIPHLRALHIPFVVKDSPHVLGEHDAKELALQIIDIITLRPEIELCYLGIASKCFEILETRQSNRDSRFGGSEASVANATTSDEEDDDADGDDTPDDDEDADDADEAADNADAAADGDDTETEEEVGDGDDVDSDVESESGSPQLRLKLREILFYDDKVSIFKARHGRL